MFFFHKEYVKLEVHVIKNRPIVTRTLIQRLQALTQKSREFCQLLFQNYKSKCLKVL